MPKHDFRRVPIAEIKDGVERRCTVCGVGFDPTWRADNAAECAGPRASEPGTRDPHKVESPVQLGGPHPKP